MPEKIPQKIKSLRKKTEKIEKEAWLLIEDAKTLEELDKVRVGFLGRNGTLTQLLKTIPQLALKYRPEAGRLANALKRKLEENLREKIDALHKEKEEKGLEIDITMPGCAQELGSTHPISQTMAEISRIFKNLGFKVVDGPEVETEYHNFTALNIPEGHPSRETFHTFYLDDGTLLRSQTSPVQIRVMQKEKPPLRIIAPGKVYRPDATDASHSFMFHQVEGLAVDKKINLADLKGALTVFVREMFGKKTKMRFRPHFFPFTEPSAEVDISCIICGGSGCRVCSFKGWLEILGAGIVDPNVFKAVKYDPESWSGYAFGMGVERIAMLKYGITDIRMFFENDVRFLRQF
ncbi:MAG: phenylalanine--tRNA ligase subunit alpha [Candidatus Omnitrophica bacterium]|nr:phenylalanine--tRNA ligase subunit alpha [Candidatus Omnitrophota bacterium]